MIGAILEFLTDLLKAIPFFDKWFTKSTVEKIQDEKRKVDEEHDKNVKAGRPSGDFWKDRA